MGRFFSLTQRNYILEKKVFLRCRNWTSKLQTVGLSLFLAETVGGSCLHNPQGDRKSWLEHRYWVSCHASPSFLLAFTPRYQVIVLSSVRLATRCEVVSCFPVGPLTMGAPSCVDYGPVPWMKPLCLLCFAAFLSPIQYVSSYFWFSPAGCP